MISETTEFLIFFPYDILINIIILGVWGGVVNFLLKKTSSNKMFSKMLKQVIVSGFVSILISLVFIKEGLGKESILIGAGVGGVSGRKILEVIIEKINSLIIGEKSK
ncbi:hypothetical protein NP681_004484 [Salmonella enterica]|nr:hypothetical protein [Salmonella enterica]EJR3519423.1 hypothetical protein [Salmonella enterica]